MSVEVGQGGEEREDLSFGVGVVEPDRANVCGVGGVVGKLTGV
jgi:hypothetical protein